MLNNIIATKTKTFIYSLLALNLNASQPNIIYIKTDDQRYDSLSMTGHPVTQTPHLDQLAKDGAFFDQAVITSPICGPSRANTFSGQWERKNQIGFSGYLGNDMTSEVFDNSWLMRLQSAGYETGYIGKNHVNIGLGKNKHYMQKSLDFAYIHKGHIGFHLSRYSKFSNLKNQTQVEGLMEATEAFLEPSDKEYFYSNADASVVDFLKRRNHEKPFALSINFNLPHASSIGGMGGKASDPDLYKTLYSEKLDHFPLPKGFPNIPEPLPSTVFQRSELMPYYQYKTKNGLIDTMVKMARANTAIDLFIGSLREHLNRMAIADNTIIVFASDHGLLLGEKGLGGKTFLYEDSVRIPLIIYAPFLKDQHAAKRHQQLVVGQDIPATILDLCGTAIPDTYQGKSLVPILKGIDSEWREDVFLENLFTKQGYPRMEAVRSHQWKYIRYFSKEHDRDQYLPHHTSEKAEEPIYEELFNLVNDPQEEHNLAGDHLHLATLNMYRARCKKLVYELAQ